MEQWWGSRGLAGKINFHICDFTYVMLLIQIGFGRARPSVGEQTGVCSWSGGGRLAVKRRRAQDVLRRAYVEGEDVSGL